MQKIISYRHEIIWGLFLIFLPFSKALINIVLVLGILVFIYDSICEKSVLSKPKAPFVILLILIIYLFINAFSQGSFEDNRSFYKLYPLLIGVYFATINLKENSIITIKKISALVSVVYVLICLVRILLYFIQFKENPFGNSGVVNTLLLTDRPYAGCFLLINIILLWDLFRKEIQKKNKLIYLISILLLTVFIVFIAARLALLSLLIISVVYILFFFKMNLKVKLSLLLGIPLLLVALLFSSKGLQQRLFIGDSFEVFKDYEPRFVIWEGVFEIVGSDDFNRINGMGNYQTIETKLVSHYEKIEGNTSKREYYLSEKFNVHNQYLDLLLFGGLIAFLLFVIFSIQLFFMFRADFISLAILCALLLFLVVENVFHRQIGCYLFMLYIILAYKNFLNNNLVRYF